MRLILFRHGDTERRAASGRDFDRVLTLEGAREAAEVAARLAAAGFIPDVALVSTAARALETWEAAKPFFPAARFEPLRELYGADARELLKATEGVEGALMLVAHNPGLQDFAAKLALELGEAAVAARLERSFPTGSAAVFDRGAAGGLRALYTPKDAG